MSPRTIACPHCGSPIKVKESHVGQWVPCPNCEGEFQVPPPNSAKTARTSSSHRSREVELEEAQQLVPLNPVDDDEDLVLGEADVVEVGSPPERESRPATPPKSEPVSTTSNRRPGDKMLSVQERPETRPRASAPRARRPEREPDFEERESSGGGRVILALAIGALALVMFLALLGVGAYFLFFKMEPNANNGQNLAQQNTPVIPNPTPVIPNPNPVPDQTGNGQGNVANNGQAPIANNIPNQPMAPVQPQPQPIPQQPVVPPIQNPVPNPPVVNPPVINPPGPDAFVVHQLKYNWPLNQEFHYRVSIDAKVGAETERTSGMCSYQVVPAPAGNVKIEPEKGSGTAFIVTSDGLLVTCEHVVNGARTIEVLINGQRFPATVVAADRARDIALIKINAQNLPTIGLGNSDAVQLAQTIRVVGFPLSDVLGQNIKVTTGTVSGLNQEASGKIIQTDASINPGNSGGPVINEYGEVIGIASAKLTGEDVSTVGFAVPINDAKTLLQQRGITLPMIPRPMQKLDGPALAERTTRATVLVQVLVAPSERQSNLTFSASLSQTTMPNPGGNVIPIPSFPRIRHGSGKVVVDEFGKVLHTDGEPQLPYLMGPFSTLALEPLSGQAAPQWSEQSAITITRVESDGSPFGMFGPRFRGPRGFPTPFDNNEKRTVYQATRRATYQLGETNNDITSIKVTYELKSQDDPVNPYVHLTGGGQWHFNKKSGATATLDLKMQLARHTDNVTMKIPFNVHVESVDPKVVAEERKAAQARAAELDKTNQEKAWQELQNLAGPKSGKLVQRFRLEGNDQPQLGVVTRQGHVLLGTSSGRLLYFENTKPEFSGSWNQPLSSRAPSPSFNADQSLAAIAADRKIRLVKFSDPNFTQELESAFFPFEQAVLSRDGKRAAGTTFNGEIAVFDLATNQRTIRKSGFAGAIDGLATEDGLGVHWLTGDKYALMNWEQDAVTPVALNRGPAGHIWAGRLSIKGDAVLLGSSGAYWWDREKNDATKKLECPASHHRGWALSRDGRYFASCESKDALVLDVAKNAVIERWQADTNSVRSMTFSEDGRYLLTIGGSRFAILWDLKPDATPAP